MIPNVYGSLPYGAGGYLGGNAVLLLVGEPLAASSDPDFAEGLNATVAIEFDVNSPGSSTDEDADTIEDWQPVSGFDAIPCRLMIREPTDRDLGDRPSGQLIWRVMFGQRLALDQRYRLVYRDPDSGLPRYGYIKSRIINRHQMDHHWALRAIEYVI